MNKLYIDQITRYMNNAKLQYQNYYDDMAMANGALEWMTGYLEKLLGNCQNVSDGKCHTLYRHEDCALLMGILFDLTGNDKYDPEPTKASSWS